MQTSHYNDKLLVATDLVGVDENGNSGDHGASWIYKLHRLTLALRGMPTIDGLTIVVFGLVICLLSGDFEAGGAFAGLMVGRPRFGPR